MAGAAPLRNLLQTQTPKQNYQQCMSSFTNSTAGKAVSSFSVLNFFSNWKDWLFLGGAKAVRKAGSLNRYAYVSLLGDLSASPRPLPEGKGVSVYRARGWWKSNVCGAAAASVGAAGLFVAVGGVLAWGSQHREGRLWGAGLILFAIAAVWALLAGNLGAVYPYAVEIEEGKGLRFYAPFKQLYVPIQEVSRVKWSWLWAGWVVRLRERRGLLAAFIIHRAWGQQGRELAEAIGEQLARST